MIIEAESISAGYNRRIPVLRSVSLSAESGDALALLGPNGSGKSTLLKVLGGLLPIRSGSVRIDGTPIHRIPPKERARLLAFLPQDPVLPGGITVEELVRTGRFPCRNTPFSAFSKEDEAAVAKALEKTGNRRLHSDVLRMYIELGMPVFLLWCGVTFIFTYSHMAKRYSLRVAAIYMSVTLLMFVTFLTDNTLEKYCPEIAWHLLPLILAEEERERLMDRLRGRKPLQDIGRTKVWLRNPEIPAAPEKTEKNEEAKSPAEALRRFRTDRRKARGQ